MSLKDFLNMALLHISRVNLDIKITRVIFVDDPYNRIHKLLGVAYLY